jgi:major intracellular serine protease
MMVLSEKKAKLTPFKIVEVDATIQADQLPYGIKEVEAHEIWKQGEKGEGVVIAILDTGIDTNHPDLKERIIDGRNFTPEGGVNDFEDNNGHGTHVAGIIGASEDGGGVVGIAPKCKLLICKVLDADGSGSFDGIIKGMEYARKWRGANGERVRIMNLSLGGSFDLPDLHEAVKKAVHDDICVVVASGNEGDGDEKSMEHGFPGRYNECIQVAASDEKNKLAVFSNNNLEIDVIAPGVNILSTYPKSSYARLSGTSMATPHISGILALVINMGEKKFKRKLTEAEIFALLVSTCVPLGHEPSSEGHGLPKLAFMSKVQLIVKLLRNITW